MVKGKGPTFGRVKSPYSIMKGKLATIDRKWKTVGDEAKTNRFLETFIILEAQRHAVVKVGFTDSFMLQGSWFSRHGHGIGCSLKAKVIKEIKSSPSTSERANAKVKFPHSIMERIKANIFGRVKSPHFIMKVKLAHWALLVNGKRWGWSNEQWFLGDPYNPGSRWNPGTSVSRQWRCNWFGPNSKFLMVSFLTCPT